MGTPSVNGSPSPGVGNWGSIFPERSAKSTGGPSKFEPIHEGRTPDEADKIIERNRLKNFSQASIETRTTEPVKKNAFSSMISGIQTKFRTWRSKVDAEKKFAFIGSGEEKSEAKTAMKMAILKDKIERGHLDFGRLQELKDAGSIAEPEFIKAAIYLFKDQANDDKGLMDILCEKGVIAKNSDTYNEVFADCLTNPNLTDTPLIALKIPDNALGFLSPDNDLCTNPDPKFCQAVMTASTIEEMAEIFDQFETKFPEAKKGQAGVYKGADMFKKDIHRAGVHLVINERETYISGGSLGVNLFKMSTKEAFQAVLNRLKKSTEEGGMGLEEAQALHVLKQLAVAYRGQNGLADLTGVVAPFHEQSNFQISVTDVNNRESIKSIMHFDEQCNLIAKEENQRPSSIRDVNLDGKIVSTGMRFKFPGDDEVRTELPVRSERKETEDGTIQWSCPFRENPPRKIIFYGGCRPPPPPLVTPPTVTS
ncbi:MAG: hypothetical protein LBG09_01660 [Puniceicoccales bacterium]|jgi:hypothetical protein|nr:hypothetical protein [Puniceicoccales bacterium]